MVPVRSGTLSQSGNFPLCRHSLSCGWCWNSHAADSPKPQMKTANKNDRSEKAVISRWRERVWDVWERSLGVCKGSIISNVGV